jgi:hypothetical protein
MDKCNTCLKENEVIKCSHCTYNSCENCTIQWYNHLITVGSSAKYSCPQCKAIRSYEIDYDKVIEETEDTETEETDLSVETRLFNLMVRQSDTIEDEDIEAIMQMFNTIFPNQPVVQPAVVQPAVVQPAVVQPLTKENNPEYILNPLTGRYVLRTGRIGKKIINSP